MESGRFFIIMLLFICTAMSCPGSAVASFWDSGEEQGKSGLDFERGYDLNMVTTMKGRVVSIDASPGKGPVTVLFRRGNEDIHAVMAPRWFWSGRGIEIKPHDEIVVTGAKAQGKDGKMYIITRDVSNLSTGKSVVIRSETGGPAWRGGGFNGGGGGGMRMQRGFGGGMRGR